MSFKQAERLLGDGAVAVGRNAPGHMTIDVTTGTTTQTITCSEFNAARLVGMLSLMLGIPMTKAVGKAIKL